MDTHPVDRGPRNGGKPVVDTTLPAAAWKRYFWAFAIAWTAILWGFSIWGLGSQRAKHRAFIRQIASLACGFDVQNHARSGGRAGELHVAIPGLIARLTGVKARGPEHRPDAWEARVLARLERGREAEVSEVVTMDGRSWMRLMHPLRVDAACLRCHRGYRIGDLRGGVAVAVRMDAVPIPGALSAVHMKKIAAISWILGLVAVWWFARRTGRQIRAREELIDRLKRAMDEIQTLTGLLPICAWCKRVRDDQGYWTQVEQYVREHTSADFTHGICPDCEVKVRAGMKVRAEPAAQGRQPRG